MTATETTSNQGETLSSEEWMRRIDAKLDNLLLEADHIDTQLHELSQFIDAHKPLLERFTDPGKMMRGFLGKGKGNART